MSHADTPHLFRQPKAVYAVAFACVISFMGIGLVDPILPALASELDATPSQVTLLFTSYLVVTAVMMLVTGWVSSRIGAKKTLMIGLVLIVVFAALAGTAGSVEGVIGFRAGWGLGNALFISTALATIVGSASGGTASAIMLYEAALGLGIALDDFGTGFSSLSYLKDLPIDALKLDQRFVAGLPHDRYDVAIVQAVATLARQTGLDVIAEGVENATALGLLRGYGCDMVQGYLYSPPLEEVPLVAWCMRQLDLAPAAQAGVHR